MSDEKNLSDDLNEMLGDAKENVKKAAEKTKETAAEFTSDVKEVLSSGKNVAIIAHLTIIGWIIALIMNSGKKTELGSFYIRQTLGIFLLSILSMIPFVGIVIFLFAIVLWVVSIVGALGGNTKPVFLLGTHFQNWFKSL